MTADPDQANQQMVDRLIALGALWSRPLIAAFRATPRHRFLDRVFLYQRKHQRWRELLTRAPSPEELSLLYADRALITHLSRPDHRARPAPISSSSQPSLMAQMLEDLQLQPGQRVLEIGAGTGYNAALIAHVVGPGMVTSIDVDRNVLSEAWDHLRSFPERGINLQHADGRAGFADNAPYERLIVTAATPDLEPAWLEQLAEQGLVLAPLELAPGLAFVVRASVRDGVCRGQLLRAAYFMPLRAEGETGEVEPAPLLAIDVQTLPAPWAGWFDRKRPRTSWLGFIQALALFGLVRGLEVHFQTMAGGESVYGVALGEAVCWFGAQTWYVSGETGRKLGWDLWRAFLDTGAPRPLEYDLELDPASGRRWRLREATDRPSWL